MLRKDTFWPSLPALVEAVTHLDLFRSSSELSQKVSVELSLRLLTMATLEDTFKSKAEVTSTRSSTVVSNSSEAF